MLVLVCVIAFEKQQNNKTDLCFLSVKEKYSEGCSIKFIYRRGGN